jgi:putative endonuclease
MNIVGRNVRVGHLEIDLVARESDAMVVVEVRTRGPGAWLGALHSVGFDKRERIRRAATILWLRRWTHLRGVKRVRFDAAAVDLSEGGAPRVLYVRAAF